MSKSAKLLKSFTTPSGFTYIQAEFGQVLGFDGYSAVLIADRSSITPDGTLLFIDPRTGDALAVRNGQDETRVGA